MVLPGGERKEAHVTGERGKKTGLVYKKYPRTNPKFFFLGAEMTETQDMAQGEVPRGEVGQRRSVLPVPLKRETNWGGGDAGK